MSSSCFSAPTLARLYTTFSDRSAQVLLSQYFHAGRPPWVFAAENQEFPDKAVESGQAERRKHRDAAQAGENRRGGAHPAEIVQPAAAAGARFQDADAVEERRGRDPWLNICSRAPLSAAAAGLGPAGPRRRRQRAPAGNSSHG